MSIPTIPRNELVTFWLDGSLGAVERACLRSALRQGHAVALYCYDRPPGVPEGVAVRDAAEILPPSSIIRHEGGSPALFANLFRYELQRRALGTWIDTDVYLLRPLDVERPYLFGWESARHINNAVLRLPAASPLIDSLMEPFHQRRVPPWLPWRDRVTAGVRLWRTGRTGLERMPWGVAGPKALTALVRAHGLEQWALPAATFYPVPWERHSWILDPSLTADAVAGGETVAIHLWNSLIAPFKNQPAPCGSFLARLQEEGG